MIVGGDEMEGASGTYRTGGRSSLASGSPWNSMDIPGEDRPTADAVAVCGAVAMVAASRLLIRGRSGRKKVLGWEAEVSQASDMFSFGGEGKSQRVG